MPEEIPGVTASTTIANPARGPGHHATTASYPKTLFAAPGDEGREREGLREVRRVAQRATRRQKTGRPLVLACSADLAESTNIAGFAKDFGDVKGFGWYERDKNQDGALLPQQITEFTNSGLVCGLATVNIHHDPYEDFLGYWGACSTYGSFSYLKYGLMRLFAQLAQDSPLKVGKVIWVAGHSGPETAEDSRTHFGIFAPGVTQLFPDGHVINLYPWEHNEVAPLLAAALATDAPDRGAAPDAAAGHDPRPREARHGEPLRRGARRLRDARVPARPAEGRRDHRAGHVARPSELVKLLGRRSFDTEKLERQDRRGAVVGPVPAPAGEYRKSILPAATGSTRRWSRTARAGSCATGSRTRSPRSTR